MVRAPQGLTDDRFKSLKTLSEKLSPIERYVSVTIDETILNPRLAFDSNGMIIGHAVNDVISEESNTNEQTVPNNDSLANRMICYMAQGLSQDFHHVKYFLFYLCHILEANHS